MKFGIYNYFPDVTTRANPYGAATTWVVWVNSQFATVGFLSVSFLFLQLVQRSHRWTDFNDLDVIWRLSPKDVPFGGLVDIAPQLGGQISTPKRTEYAFSSFTSQTDKKINKCVISAAV